MHYVRSEKNPLRKRSAMKAQLHFMRKLFAAIRLCSYNNCKKFHGFLIASL